MPAPSTLRSRRTSTHPPTAGLLPPKPPTATTAAQAQTHLEGAETVSTGSLRSPRKVQASALPCVSTADRMMFPILLTIVASPLGVLRLKGMKRLCNPAGATRDNQRQI